MSFDQYSVTTKLINQSECDVCSHREVCTLKADYQDQVATIRNLALEQYVKVMIRCDHYWVDIRPRDTSPFPSLLKDK